MERSRAFTLPELLFAVAIGMGLVGWGVPALRDIQRDSARTREVNQFLRAIHLARSEAMKRNDVVSLCPSGDGLSCGSPPIAWQDGWMVFVNFDRDQPAQRDPGEPMLKVYPRWKQGTIVGNRPTLSFRAFGQLAVTATFTFCDDRGPSSARAVIISQTGRPRLADRSSSGSPLPCK